MRIIMNRNKYLQRREMVGELTKVMIVLSFEVRYLLIKKNQIVYEVSFLYVGDFILVQLCECSAVVLSILLCYK